MKISRKWLEDYIDIDMSVGELADGLSMIGLTVDGVSEIGSEVEGVVVGYVREVAMHPDAGRLVVCKVDVGTDIKTIVTGAPNIREGIHVPTVLVGGRLPAVPMPGNEKATTASWEIEPVEFHGVVSEGMLCSLAEIGVAQESMGIAILDEIPGLDLVPGKDIKEVFGLKDYVYELDLTPNYASHCQSYLGVAREVSALTGRDIKEPEIGEYPASEENIDDLVSIEIKDEDLCPRYSARIVKGVKVGESTLWLQQRLEAAGMRPINNVVDVTNYVMLEYGQPLHAFDYHLVKDGKIIVRRAYEGETITTLDGVERKLGSADLLIAGSDRPLAIAGVMGSLDSEVREDTRDILIESAHFYNRSVLATARRLGINSEAASRFGRGSDPNIVAKASLRAADLLTSIAGGKVVTGIADAYPQKALEKKIELNGEYINGLLGLSLSEREMIDILESLGFSVENMVVIVPTRRPDIEGMVDLAEEIARHYGYNRIENRVPEGKPADEQPKRHLKTKKEIRERLVGLGLDEIVTYSFMHPFELKRLGVEAGKWTKVVKIANPMTEDQRYLRTTLIPNLLHAVSYNIRHQQKDLAFFELGKVYIQEGEGLPLENPVLGIGLTGEFMAGHWSKQVMKTDFFLLKGIVENLFGGLHIGKRDYQVSSYSWYHPGRQADIFVGDVHIGHLGEIRLDVAEEYDVEERVYVAEIYLRQVESLRAELFGYEQIGRYPSVQRDIAFIIDASVRVADLEKKILQAGEPIVKGVRLFDVYAGKGIPEGMHSLAFSLIYRDNTRTLQDAEVEEVHERVREILQELGASLRS